MITQNKNIIVRVVRALEPGFIGSIGLAIVVLFGLGSPIARADRKTMCFSRSAVEKAGVTTAAIDSVVMLKVTDSEGRIHFFGTGTIIAHSGSRHNRSNRILTAYHVVESAINDPDKRISVMGSDGSELGGAILAARSSAEWNLSTPGTFAGAKLGLDGGWIGSARMSADIAVLAMITPTLAYTRIPGLRLSGLQNHLLHTVLFSEAGSVEFGASGAPALDEANSISGIVIQKIQDDGISVVDTVLTPASRLLKSGDTDQGIRIPRNGRAFILPIYDSVVLTALNQAGQKIRPNRSARHVWHKSIAVPAYPLGGCLIFTGILAPWFFVAPEGITNLSSGQFSAYINAPSHLQPNAIINMGTVTLHYDGSGSLSGIIERTPHAQHEIRLMPANAGASTPAKALGFQVAPNGVPLQANLQ
jgi:hypothetical protein